MTSKERRFYYIAMVISIAFHLALLAVFIPEQLLNKPVEIDTFSVGVVNMPFGDATGNGSGGVKALITTEKPGSAPASGASQPKTAVKPADKPTDKPGKSGNPAPAKSDQPMIVKVTPPQLPASEEKSVKQTEITVKPVKQPEAASEKPVKQPESAPEKIVKQPEPEKPAKQPDPVPEKTVKQSDSIAEKPAKQPEPAPEKSVKQNETPEKVVKQPISTPEKVKQTEPVADNNGKQLQEKKVQPTISQPAKTGKLVAKHPVKPLSEDDSPAKFLKQPDNIPDDNSKASLVAKNKNGTGTGAGSGTGNSGAGNGSGNGSGNGTGMGTASGNGNGAGNGRGTDGPGGNGTGQFAAVGLGNGSRLLSGGGGKPPTYPKNALNAGKEGEVELKVYIKADGSLEKIDTLKLNGDASLEKSARYALEHSWRNLFKSYEKNYYIKILFIYRVNTEVQGILEYAETRP